MEHVTPSQAWGVSAGTAPGTTVALKNGWLPVGSGWTVNSIGWVSGYGRNYLIAVTTSGDPGMSYGIDSISMIATAARNAPRTERRRPRRDDKITFCGIVEPGDRPGATLRGIVGRIGRRGLQGLNRRYWYRLRLETNGRRGGLLREVEQVRVVVRLRVVHAERREAERLLGELSTDATVAGFGSVTPDLAYGLAMIIGMRGPCSVPSGLRPVVHGRRSIRSRRR